MRSRHFALLRLQLQCSAGAMNSHCLRVSHAIALHSYAFFGCTSLTTVDLTNITSIGEYVSHFLNSPFLLNTPYGIRVSNAYACGLRGIYALCEQCSMCSISPPPIFCFCFCLFCFCFYFSLFSVRLSIISLCDDTTTTLLLVLCVVRAPAHKGQFITSAIQHSLASCVIVRRVALIASMRCRCFCFLL
jgi:hypothetical protein